MKRLAGPSLLVLLSASRAAGALAAQERVITLDRPEAQLPGEFTRVTRVRELSSGRLLVLDFNDATVQLVDSRSKSVVQVGGTGEGPREYRSPTGLFSFGPDRSLIADQGNRRFLVVGPDGTIVSEASFPDLGGFGLLSVRGADARGRIYFDGPNQGSGRTGGRDSAAMLRWHPDRPARLDTMGWVQVQSAATVRSEGGRITMTRAIRPLRTSEQWGVSEEGRIALVTPEPYRVDWLSEGRPRVAGVPVPIRETPLTEAEKTGYLGRMQAGAAPPRGFSIGGQPSGGPPPPPAAADVAAAEWPPFKPPFLVASTMVSPAGHLWVRRTPDAASQAESFDLFGPEGRRVAIVSVPGGGRLVGFATGGVYFARKDADDVEHLFKFALTLSP
ncbi:MAG: hypothetical protein HOP28_02415 [Gemmatimonadales bacterium]|nr:hypothetical protein [Gemmatimonadales bacterium]